MALKERSSSDFLSFDLTTASTLPYPTNLVIPPCRLRFSFFVSLFGLGQLWGPAGDWEREREWQVPRSYRWEGRKRVTADIMTVAISRSHLNSQLLVPNVKQIHTPIVIIFYFLYLFSLSNSHNFFYCISYHICHPKKLKKSGIIIIF